MSLIRRVFEIVEGRSVPVALIGGVALAAHGIVRATKDADLLATDLGLLDATVWMPLEAESVTVSVNRGDVEDPLAGVVRFRRDPEPPVDLVLGRERWLDGVLARRQPVELSGVSLQVVTAADLVLLKLDAGGPIDLIDARLLLSGPDGPGLRKTIEALALELPRRLQEPLKKLLSAESDPSRAPDRDPRSGRPGARARSRAG
jgi:hypothetical protein